MIKRFLIILGVTFVLTGCNKNDASNTELSTQHTHQSQQQDAEDVLLEETEITEKASSWVKDLALAETTTQIIAVVEHEGDATISMHTKDEAGVWCENFSVEGRIGKKGIGKTKEGDKKTPTGVYKFTHALGILPDPGISALPYLQVDGTHHWVDDSNSKYYNQLVSTREVEMDWSSSENLYKSTNSYKYVLALNYNEECVPGEGSAIFMHCPSKGNKKTSGCISIPEENMIQAMQMLQEDCVIVIDSEENIMSY